MVPINLNNNGKLDDDENFYGKLDEVIKKLESRRVADIPVEYINISYPSQVAETNRNISVFLEWALTKGQKFNHEFGFLDFEPEALAKQKEILAASKTP